MIYRVTHSTKYQYKRQVSIAEHAVCLWPRSFSGHHCQWHALEIIPAPSSQHDRVDYFGNRLTLFTIQKDHREFVVRSRSEVEVGADARPWPQGTLAWERVRQALPEDRSPESLDAYQFVFESPRIRPSPEFAAYAIQSFEPERPLGEALLDLTERIHLDFRFDSKATEVTTPPEEVFRKRGGVCQDFAHLQIACLRSLGLAARYVSGYLRTYPPPGRARLVGADASHAWVSVYSIDGGWLEVDPTNNVKPSNGHITIGWGRDYGDVPPVRGVVLGGGEHTIKVAVDVEATV
jgi:transglutaminase-like putative cysteine protease